MARSVAVVGCGQTKFTTRRSDVSAPELVYEAVRNALDDAGVGIRDVDAVVFASAPEAFEGVNWPDKWCLDAAGGIGRPFMRIHTGGATGASGAIAGYSHVASGMFETVLVIALQRVGESADAQFILNTICDPVYEKDFAINTITTMAMRANLAMDRWGVTEEHFARISLKNHLNALNNPYAHLRKPMTLEDALQSTMLCYPLKLLDVCPRSDGACAVVLASEERARKLSSSPAWIHAMASATDGYFLGDRDLLHEDESAMRLAVRKAYSEADITDPLHQLDVIELYSPSTITEMIWYIGLGLCSPSELGQFITEGRFEMNGTLPVNPSGGVQCANPIGATALVRIAEAAWQVMGRAGQRQVANVERAMATGAGGLGQFYTVTLLGSKKK